MTKPNTTKAFSYVRFSTPEQAKGNSLDRQVALAADYAARNNLDLDTELTFKDLGVSAFTGVNAATGALSAFKAAVETGLVPADSYLLVESLDRISRQTARKAVRILEDICELGITVVTLSDSKVYTADSLDNDQFSFILSILIFMRANEESTTKAKRLSAAWEAKRAKAESDNKPLSKVVVGWVRLSDDRSTIELIPERAEIVRGIYQDFLSGMGTIPIAKKLNLAGVKTWGSGKKAAVHWHPSYITKILKNPAVTGSFTPCTLVRTATTKQRIAQTPIPDYYPAAIDDMTFMRVQDLFGNKGTRGRKEGDGVNNILSYLGKCSVCGGTVTRITKGGTWQYLVCVKGKLRAGCDYHGVPYQKVESAILKALPLMLPVIKTDSLERSEIRKQIAKLEIGTKQKQIEINRLITLIKSGELETDAMTYHDNDEDIHTFRTVRDDIRDLEIFIRLNSIQIEQLEKEYQKNNPRIIDEKFQALLRALKSDAGKAEINACLRAVFSHVVIDYKQNMVLMQFKHRDAALPVPWDK